LFGPSDAVVVTAVAGSGGVSAVIDLRSRRVPNPLTLGVAALGLTLAALGLSGHSPMGAVAGLALGLLLMLPGHVIGATGAGDVKLLAALGTLLGPRGVVVAFVYAALAGGLLALIVARRRRVLRQTLERTATLVRPECGRDRAWNDRQPLCLCAGDRNRGDRGGAWMVR
jgi:Flp pilus assembly protein protease CpaA